MWLPAGTPRAVVVLVHGYAEHAGRYAHTGERLAREGYAVHAFDLRGHGRSDGDTALVKSFGQYLDDLRLFIRRVRGAHSGLPLFVLGHSMGGAIVTLYAAVDRPPVQGVLLSGAVLPQKRGPGVFGALVRLIGRLAPRLGIVSLDANAISRDPNVVADYVADPLVYHGKIQSGLMAAMVRAGSRIDRDSAAISMPLLIMHGGDDALANPDGSRRLHARVSSSDKTLRIYDGLHHEILNEPERDTVLDDIVAWLDARTGT
jgi:alpha-beta hydrolase superfamily lysophospholipase